LNKLFYIVIIVDELMYITPASSPALFPVNLFPELIKLIKFPYKTAPYVAA